MVYKWQEGSFVAALLRMTAKGESNDEARALAVLVARQKQKQILHFVQHDNERLEQKIRERD
jgi:hypothetical protein